MTWTLEQFQSVGALTLTWRLTLDGQVFRREVTEQEMVDDSDGFWLAIQTKARKACFLESSAKEVLGGPVFGFPRGSVEPELLKRAEALRESIARALFPDAPWPVCREHVGA